MRGSKRNKPHWRRAQELAQQGYKVTEAARILGIHHATAIYIAEQMGFRWQKTNPTPAQETMGRVERMMRLACR